MRILEVPDVHKRNVLQLQELTRSYGFETLGAVTTVAIQIVFQAP